MFLFVFDHFVLDVMALLFGRLWVQFLFVPVALLLHCDVIFVSVVAS